MGLRSLWAHNLFVVGLKISYYGSFSAERLKATPNWYSLFTSFPSNFLNPYLLPTFFYLQPRLVGWLWLQPPLVLLKVQCFLIKVDVQVGGRCGIYDLGTWFHLARLCSAIQFPVQIAPSRDRFIYMTGNFWPTTTWTPISYTYLFIKEASRREQENWTFLMGLCLRPAQDWAQGLYGPVPKDGMRLGPGLCGPGILVPYRNQRATVLWRSTNFVRSIAVKAGPKRIFWSLK